MLITHLHLQPSRCASTAPLYLHRHVMVWHFTLYAFCLTTKELHLVHKVHLCVYFKSESHYFGDLVLLGYDALSIGKYLMTFRKCLLRPSSGFVLSQYNWIFVNIAVKTSNFAAISSLKSIKNFVAVMKDLQRNVYCAATPLSKRWWLHALKNNEIHGVCGKLKNWNKWR